MTTISLQFKDKNIVNVEVPNYLHNVLTIALNKAVVEKRVHNNLHYADVCYLCGLNQIHLSTEQLNWADKHICALCDKKTPFLLQRVSQICNFEYCDITWYCNNILGVPSTTNVFMLEGSITHAIDDLLIDYLADRDNYKKLRKVANVSGKDGLYEELLKILEKLFDKALEQLESKVTPQLIDVVKTNMFNDSLSDLAQVTAIRLYHNIQNQGEYQKIVQKRWTELKLIGYYINHGIKLLIVGHIDKLYRLDDNTFVIRDKKTTRVLRLGATANGHFYDAHLQLGGYNYLLSQFYGANVSVIGEIEWTRYFDVLPIFCDVKGFTDVCDKLCLFILHEKPPIGRPRGSLCSINTCSFFSLCKEKFSKERM